MSSAFRTWLSPDVKLAINVMLGQIEKDRLS
jgi:hypothetical protein